MRSTFARILRENFWHRFCKAMTSKCEDLARKFLASLLQGDDIQTRIANEIIMNMFNFYRYVSLIIMACLFTGCDCSLFGGDDDDGKGSQRSGANGAGSGGGQGPGGGQVDVPEIDPSSMRGGLIVLSCCALILVDRKFRGRNPSEAI